MERSTCVAVLLALCALAAACGRGAATPEPPASPAPRVASLSPAISRTLVSLGLAGNVVGRSAFCRAIDPAVPVVGDLYEVDFERLLRVQPTHVFVQPPSAGLDRHLGRLAAERGWVIGQWHIDTIDEIERTIREIPATLFGPGDPRRAEAAGRAAVLLHEIALSLSPQGRPLWTGRTLLVADADPVLVVGRETYLDDVLRALGGVNAVDAAGWIELSLEDVMRLDPQAMIVLEAGDAEGSAGVDAGALGRLDTAARRDGRIAVLRHPDVHLPSSAVTGVAAEMRAILRALAETAP